MARYALVIDGVVTEERNYDSPPAAKMHNGKPLLHPIIEVKKDYNPDAQTYTVNREVQGFKVVDTWVIQDLPRETVNARLLAALAAHRYQVETGGMTFNGVTIQTDRESRANLIAARIIAKENSGYTATWKTPAGFVVLTAAEIIAVADAVAAFVQKCFEAEAGIAEAIGEYISVTEVNAAFDEAIQA